ncbi:MAG: Crp/Fnr family transcriptional regulator [Candidatus Methylacidiphilales bacterium]
MNELEALTRQPLFAWISSQPMEWLSKECPCLDLKENEILYEEGSTSEALHLVISGALRIEAQGHPPIRIGKDSILGECSLIEVRRRAAKASASEPSRVMIIHHSTLLRFARQFPDPYSIIITNLARQLARRLRELNDQKARASSPTTLPPLSS